MNKLVFDIGGTFIKYALMDNDANILEKGSYPTPLEDRNEFLDTLASKFETYQDQCDGIAISLPGCIDTEHGYVYTPGALTFNYCTPLAQDLQDVIESRTGRKIPIALENDGKAAALAEVWKGNLADVDDGVVIILGTGIGGGIVKDRRILKGKAFFAGEFSFLMNDVSKTGFHNAFALSSSTSALVQKTAANAGLDPKEVDGFKVFELLDQEHEGAHAAFDEATKAIGGTIYNLTCILNPQKVLIGGGISKQPKVVEKIREQADLFFNEIENMGMYMPKPHIDVCAHFNDSNMIGALYNYKLMYE